MSAQGHVLKRGPGQTRAGFLPKPDSRLTSLGARSWLLLMSCPGTSRSFVAAERSDSERPARVGPFLTRCGRRRIENTAVQQSHSAIGGCYRGQHGVGPAAPSLDSEFKV
jgi:hypothetical protein